jgi:hypothetical protein
LLTSSIQIAINSLSLIEEPDTLSLIPVGCADALVAALKTSKTPTSWMRFKSFLFTIYLPDGNYTLKYLSIPAFLI